MRLDKSSNQIHAPPSATKTRYYMSYFKLKLNIMKHSLLIIIAISLFTSCKKNKNDVIEETNTTVYLRDKSLTEVKSEVRGNWKIHYKYGGITGNIKTQLTNSNFKVLQNDSIYLKISNSSIAEDKAIFQ